MAGHRTRREPTWAIYSARLDGGTLLVLWVAVAMLPLAAAPPQRWKAECAGYRPGEGFTLVGAWAQNKTGRGGPSPCEQVASLPDAPARTFLQCGCALLRDAAEERHSEYGTYRDGERMLVTARRLLPHHRAAWQARRDEDRVQEKGSWHELMDRASTEHREVVQQIQLLRGRQARTDCSAARALVVSLEDLPNLGATLQLLNAGLSFASMTERILVMAEYDSWPMIDPSACRSQSWGCLFAPLSFCSEHELASSAFEPLIRDTTESWLDRRDKRVLHARAAYELFVAMGVHAYGAAANCRRSSDGSLIVTPQCPLTWSPLPSYPASPQALPMWRAALAAELFRPSVETARNIRDTAQRIGFETTSTAAAGCHVRRGDKVQGRDKQADLMPSARYVERLKALLGHHARSFSSLFIATDDEDALREVLLETRRSLPWLRPVYDAHEKRALRANLVLLNDSSVSPAAVAAGLNRIAIARDAVTNLALLVSTQALVGTWSSVFGKVAQYTRAGRALLFCGSRGAKSMLSAGLGEDLDAPDLALCTMGAQLYDSLDESAFAEFDPL